MHLPQDYTNEPVPKGKGPRYGWLYLVNVESAVTICVPVFMIGALLGTSMPLSTLLWALLISGVVLSLLSGWSSYIGTKTRMSTPLLVENAFGKAGSKIVWLVLALSLLGWFGVQTEIFAKAFLTLIERVSPGLPVSSLAVTIFSGALMASTAVLGIRGVGKLAQVSIPVLVAVMVYAVYHALSTKGLAPWMVFDPKDPMGIGITVASIIGAYSVGVIVMPDIKRFAVNATQSISSGVVGLGIIYPVVLLMTACTAVLMAQPDFMLLLVDSGLGGFALFILMLATWTTNDLNLYSASLNISPMFPNVSRPWLTAIAGAVGTIIAVFGIFEHLIPFFSLLGVMTTPLLAIYSADFLSGRLAKHQPKEGVVWKSFVIWGGASLLGIVTTPVDQFGFGLFELTTVPGLDSLLAGAVLAFASTKCPCKASCEV